MNIDKLNPIDIPIYGGKLIISFSKKKYRRNHKKLTKSECNDYLSLGISCAYCSNNTIVHTVGVFDDSLTTLIHELAHVTFNILNNAGVVINKGKMPSNEEFCYLLDHLV